MKNQNQIYKAQLASQVLAARRRRWKCGICGFINDSGGTVCQHIKNVHNYPDEDAMLETKPVDEIKDRTFSLKSEAGLKELERKLKSLESFRFVIRERPNYENVPEYTPPVERAFVVAFSYAFDNNIKNPHTKVLKEYVTTGTLDEGLAVAKTRVINRFPNVNIISINTA